MRINAISAPMFAGKQAIAKKAAAGLMTAAGAGLAADSFVKGLSKPNKAVEGEDTFIRANDDGTNPFDLCCGDEQEQARRDWCCED